MHVGGLVPAAAMSTGTLLEHLITRGSGRLLTLSASFRGGWTLRLFALACLVAATPVQAAVPGAFSLGGATPACSGGAPRITLNWTASSGVSTYDVYRNGSLYSPGVPAGTLTFLNTGSNVSPGATYTYFIRARNASGSRDSGAVSATALSNCAGTDGASFVSETVPDGTAFAPGQSYTKTWTLRNSGTTVWDSRYSLQYSHGDAGCSRAARAVVGTVGASGTYSFSTTCTAPSSLGSFREDWRLVGPTGPVSVGGASTVWAAIRTVGAVPGPFALTSANPSCSGGAPRIMLEWTAASGVSTYDVYRNGSLYSPGVPAGTLTFLNTGPNVAPGSTYSYFVRARNVSGFRDSGVLQATALNICGGTDGASFVSETVPDGTAFAPGQSYTKTWTLRNSGTTVWDARYSLQYVSGDAGCSHSARSVSGSVGVSGIYAFAITCTTPSTTGTFREDWRLVGPSGAINIGGASTVWVTIQAVGVGPGAFSLTSATPSCSAGTPRVTLTWTAASGATTYDVYRNGSLYSPGVPAGTLTFLNTGSNVSPGATYTYFIRARNASGSRASGAVSTTALSNCAGTDGASFVSETVPDGTAFSPGQSYTKTWTLRNSGTTVWDARYSLQYVSGDAGCSHSARVVSGSVAANGTQAFSTTCTALQQPGSYQEAWRLLGPSGVITVTGRSSLSVAIQIRANEAPGAFTLTPGVPSCNGGTAQIAMGWTAASGASSYDVYRNGTLYFQGVSGTLLRFINTGSLVTPGATYTYFIRARNSFGTTDSGTVQMTAPFGCNATAGATLVSETIPDLSQLSPGQSYTKTWTLRNTGTTVWGPGESLQFVSGDAGCSHVALAVSGQVAPNQHYTFAVACTVAQQIGTYREDWRLVGSAGAIPISSGITVRVVVQVLSDSPPGAFSLSDVSSTCAGPRPQVVLTWSASVGASTYEVYRDGRLYSPGVPASLTAFTNTLVTPGTSYTYFVRARNRTGLTTSNSRQITAQACPEGSPSVSVSPSTGDVGTLFEYEGRDFSTGGRIAVHIRGPNGQELAPSQNLVSASGRFDGAVESTELAPGSYRLWVVDERTATSSNEAPFTVTVASVRPSLTSVGVSPVDATAGQTIDLSYNISNSGTVQRTAYLGIRVFASGTTSAIPLSGTGRTITVLAGNSSHSRTVTLPPSTPPGTYDLVWSLWNQDPSATDEVIEFATARRSGALTVVSQPQAPTLVSVDLVSGSSGASARGGASVPLVGPSDSLTLQYTINNPTSTSVSVVLDGGLYAPGGVSGLEDQANLKMVTVPPGRSTHTRLFRIPLAATQPLYDVLWSIWNRAPLQAGRVKFGEIRRRGFLSLLAPVQLDGRITSYVAGEVVRGRTLSLRADAWSNISGAAVAKVEFLARYRGEWKKVGTATSPPFAVEWSVPAGLGRHTIALALNIADSRGYLRPRAAELEIAYEEPDSSARELTGIETAYLNQRALHPFKGDAMCSAASIAMMLAMNGVIAKDFEVMKAKANLVYPKVLALHEGKMTAFVWRMVVQLKDHGLSNVKYHDVSEDDAWDLLQREITAGNPVIVRANKSATRFVTEEGHYVVAVGYSEVGGRRLMKAYDPFGRWIPWTMRKDPSDLDEANYHPNNPDDTGISVMQPVEYDFEPFFLAGGGTNFLITGEKPAPLLPDTLLASIPSPAVADVSEERGQLGYFDGLTFTPVAFSDPDLAGGSTSVRALHIVELRQRIDGARKRAGLPDMVWTNAPLTPGSSVIRAQDIADLRTAIAEVYANAGMTLPTYTRPGSVAGLRISAVDILEIRAAVVGVE